MQNKMVGIALLCLIAILIVIQIIRDLRPRSTITIQLFKLRGPRTDIKNMTKEELYKSGFTFFIWSVLLVVLLFIFTLLFNGQKELNPYVVAFYFTLTIVFFTTLGASLVLYVRGLFRKKEYVPPAREIQ
jgi:drug/metabolite transporter (DMT)-like permease